MALFFVLSALAINCGNGSSSGPGNDSSSLLSVKMMYSYSGKGDRSYNDQAYLGLFSAMQAADFEKIEVAPETHDQAKEILSGWLSSEAKGLDLIIVAGSSYADIMDERGWDLNGHRMLFLDAEAPAREGLISVVYRTFAPSYLAGLCATRVSAARKCSAIGGMKSALVDEFIDGFHQGVESRGGGFLGPFYLASDESGFSLTNAAQDLALDLHWDNGVDVIFPVAGRSGLGVLEASQEFDSPFYVIGVDSDQSNLGPGVVLGSVVKRLDRVILETITEAVAGRFTAGPRLLGLDTLDTEFVLNPRIPDCQDIPGQYSVEALQAEAAYLSGGS
ncbi:MAG: BMP family ABC transporter substrate-binding protein [bacterium]|nr:BMP family ABC transporter substrate-binding protein [bacterium]